MAYNIVADMDLAKKNLMKSLLNINSENNTRKERNIDAVKLKRGVFDDLQIYRL